MTEQPIVNIRLATPGDIPALRTLIEQAVRGLNSQDYTPAQVESALKYVMGMDTQLIEDNSYYVVVQGEQSIGSGGWSRRKTLYGGDQAGGVRAADLLDPATEPARIRAFYVHPAWARQGIGSRLMAACETAARAAGFRRLELTATRTGQPLYARHGFTGVEPVEIVMPDGQVMAATKMVKELG
jgi:predicted N-acetyltransferase YhbS